MKLDDYITSRGDWTLEQIAIEVGLRKVGCSHTWKKIALVGTHRKECLDCWPNTGPYSNTWLIEAAFPFKAIHHFDSKSDTLTGIRSNGNFDWSGARSGYGSTNAKWKLTNPLLVQGAVKRSIENDEGVLDETKLDLGNPTVEPECRCVSEITSFGLVHSSDCAYMAWKVGK